MSFLRPAVAAVVGASAARAVLIGLRRTSVAQSLDRTNHAGRTVSLAEGPAAVVGLAAAAALDGLGPLVATAGAGAFGAIDDFAGDSASKGLKGHLNALAHGRVTTGVVKIVGLGATGLAAAWFVDQRDRRDGIPHGALDTAIGGAVVAGAANLANLLDLRPGRALKIAVLIATPMAGAPARRTGVAGAIGVAAALLPEDLNGRTMLGDTGANAIGAHLGATFLRGRSRGARLAALAALAGLILASEKVSFTKVIESTPGLREFDAWGRPRA